MLRLIDRHRHRRSVCVYFCCSDCTPHEHTHTAHSTVLENGVCVLGMSCLHNELRSCVLAEFSALGEDCVQ